MEVIDKPHDKLFRYALENLNVAKEFLLAYLPDDVLSMIDVNTIAFKATNFISEAYKEKETDVLYSVQTKKGIGYIYLLIEHQTKFDQLMPVRLSTYTNLVINKHLANTNNKLPVPPVYTAVVYTGVLPKRVNTDYYSLFGHNADLMREWSTSPYPIIHLPNAELKDLDDKPCAKLLTLVYKGPAPDRFVEFANEVVGLMKRLDEQTWHGFLHFVIIYLMNKIGQNAEEGAVLVEKISQHLSQQLRGDTVTIAESFRQEGRQEGRKLMLKEMAANLFSQGWTKEQVAKTAKVSTAELDELLVS